MATCSLCYAQNSHPHFAPRHIGQGLRAGYAAFHPGFRCRSPAASPSPDLNTPPDLWERTAALGQTCRKKKPQPGSLDLLHATVAVQATLLTFDDDFPRLAALSTLSAKLLTRPKQ